MTAACQPILNHFTHILQTVGPACPEHSCVCCRTLDVLRYLREHNRNAQIIALAVLPRGWTDAWHVYDWPSMYKLGIDVINRALKDFAAQDDDVHYLDCGSAVTPGGQVGLRSTLLTSTALLCLCCCMSVSSFCHADPERPSAGDSIGPPRTEGMVSLDLDKLH